LDLDRTDGERERADTERGRADAERERADRLSARIEELLIERNAAEDLALQVDELRAMVGRMKRPWWRRLTVR